MTPRIKIQWHDMVIDMPVGDARVLIERLERAISDRLYDDRFDDAASVAAEQTANAGDVGDVEDTP